MGRSQHYGHLFGIVYYSTKYLGVPKWDLKLGNETLNPYIYPYIPLEREQNGTLIWGNRIENGWRIPTPFLVED